MKIAIDIDDVLANFMQALITYHNKIYRTNLAKEHFTTFDLSKTWGGTQEEAVNKVFKFYETEEFTNVEVIKGAKNAVHALKQQHELVIVTARPEDLRNKTEEWIHRHFPTVFSEIHIANRFSKSGPKMTKAEICEKNGVTMLIDDSLDYALESVTPDRRVPEEWRNPLNYTNSNLFFA
jgi:uncharacterized HAD superfamily protein